MALPQSFLQELRSRNPIDEVLSRYVQLKRSGSNYTCCCPFHSEKTPSFTVFKNSDSFYCFGCGAGGDVITFVMKMENVDYITAVRSLAERSGLVMPEDDSFRYTKRIDKNRYFELNKCAARFFYDSLIKPENAEALNYITGRGLTPATIKRFGIGYADNAWDSLTGHLLAKGFEKEEIKTAFLAGESQKTGKLFDYFRNRIMFPIFDTSGNVIAFGGRIIGQGEPKYLNSSDTPVFKKRNNLYALEKAKNNTDSTLILCEGYMDVVALQQAGFINAVATLGTAITPDQARIMTRYANTVYVTYDSDGAGRRATDKAIKILGDVGIQVKVLTVTDAKDPDEFIKKFGKAAFEKLMNSSGGHIEYTLGEIKKKYNLLIPEQKLKYVYECCAMLSDVPGAIEREIYIQRIVNDTGISADIIRNECKKQGAKHRREEEKERIKNDIDHSIGYQDRINSESAKNLATVKKEENLLGILLLRPEFVKGEKLSGILSEDIFECEFSKRIYRKIVSETDIGEFDLSHFGEEFEADEMGRITKMIIQRKNLQNNSDSVALELAEALFSAKEKKDTDDADDDFVKKIERIRNSKK